MLADPALGRAARHLHVIGARRDRRAIERAVAVRDGSSGESYADQYVQNLKGIVLTDSNLRKMIKEHDLYPDYDDETARAQRLKPRHQRAAS